MITCSSCGTKNKTEFEKCKYCKADLLPEASEETIMKMLVNRLLSNGYLCIRLIIGFMAIVILFTVINLLFNVVTISELASTLIGVAMFFLVIFLISFLIAFSTMKKKAGFEKLIPSQVLAYRFALRGKQNSHIDPVQAISDFSHALKIMPSFSWLTKSLVLEIYSSRDRIYTELKMPDDSISGWQQLVIDYNRAIEFSTEQETQRNFVIARENLIKKHHLQQVFSKKAQECASCGKVFEGKTYSFDYGILADTKVALGLTFIGTTTTKKYRDMTTEVAFICYKCVPTGDVETGASLAIEKAKKMNRHQDCTYFTPSQYEQLKKYSKPR